MRFRTLLHVLFAATLACTLSLSAQARDKAARGKAETITGCLQKSAEPNKPNAFQLTDANGKVYGVTSSTVKLADHVGQEVKVTGHQMKEMPVTGTNTGATTGAEPKTVMEINATHVKMVNKACR